MTLIIDKTTWQSPNHSERKEPIRALVLHSTEGLMPGTAEWMTAKHSKVSCHYLIDRRGHIFQLVDPDRVAWHAGESRYWTGRWWRWDWNGWSIGIELEHVAGQNYPLAQMASCRDLCRSLVHTYAIPAHLVVAHRWIATPRGRRSDPTNMSDPVFRELVASFYRDSFGGDVVTYRVTAKAFPRAIVRAGPSTKSKDTGKRLNVSTSFRGILTTKGERHKNDARWVEREDGGFVWFGLLEVIP